MKLRPERLAGLLTFTAGVAWAQALPAPSPVVAAAQVTVPRSTQHDLVSKINGEAYRVMVATPPGYDPGKAYPVLYVLEGNVYFATAADAMTRQALFRNTAPALVVGIGYPTDDTTIVNTRRWFDLSPTVSPDPNEKRKTGGSDAFLRVIEEEIKPLVASRFNVDSSTEALWGHSLGGLAVLRAMMRRPGSFTSYLISSPSIWWDGEVVLKDEVSFAKFAAEPGRPIRILITSAGEEQYRGDDPKLLSAAARMRMVDNSSELAARLSGLGAKRLIIQRYILEGETHITVSHSALTRSLRFALPFKQPTDKAQ